MNKHKSSAELKALAREQLTGKYSPAIGVIVILLLMTYITTDFSALFGLIPGIAGTIISYVLSFIISVFLGLFTYGCQFAFLKIACNAPVRVNDIFAGFKNGAGKIMLAQLIISAIVTAGAIPFYILGGIFQQSQNMYLIGPYFLSVLLMSVVQIMAQLILGQVYYIMLDFPTYSATQALAFSAKLMKGNKGRLFYIMMSFIPVYLLGICTCCIGFLWVMPYTNTTYANFYIDLVQNKDF